MQESENNPWTAGISVWRDNQQSDIAECGAGSNKGSCLNQDT